MASTGSRARLSRRELLGGLALSLGPWAWAREAGAEEYASARDVFDAVDRLEADVAARLAALGEALPSARPFVAGVLGDHARHREERRRLRRRLRLPASSPATPGSAADRSLAGLRAAQEALTFAHAEGLPALGDARAVHRMARHMIDHSRHLTVIDLWIQAEEERG